MGRFSFSRPSARRVAPGARRALLAAAFAAAGVELLVGAASRFLAPASPSRSSPVRMRALAQVDLDVPVDVRATEAAEAAYEAAREQRRRAKEANATNATLKLGDGFPGNLDREPTKNGPQWATCFVDHKEAGRVSEQGVTPPRNVLEEWVLRGEHEQLSSFKSWATSRGGEASVRCVPLSAKSTEDIFCLECITHASSGALPFTPEGHVTVMDSGSSILTFGGLSECLSSTVGRGFCMKGSIAVPSL